MLHPHASSPSTDATKRLPLLKLESEKQVEIPSQKTNPDSHEIGDSRSLVEDLESRGPVGGNVGPLVGGRVGGLVRPLVGGLVEERVGPLVGGDVGGVVGPTVGGEDGGLVGGIVGPLVGGRVGGLGGALVGGLV
jgi:hypothetical protein